MNRVGKSTGQDTKPGAIANQVLGALSERSIAPTPENYTVWYCYLSGEHPEIKKALTSLLASNPAFGASELKKLFDTFIGRDRQASAIDSVAAQLMEELQDVLKNLHHANTVSGSYGESLDTLSGAIGRGVNPSDLQPAISAVAQATQTMVSENLALASQLTTSTSEINQLKTDLEDMRIQALTDGLTGIANRKCFDVEIENAIQFAKSENVAVSLLMLDIDHFKSFNDTHGHQVGDQVIKLLADILKDSVKGQDTPARYGGEEFSIILPETKLQGAVGLAEALRNRIVKRPLVNKVTGDSFGKITISVGAAQHIADESSEDFIARADKALYGAKNAGRDQVVAA